MSVITLILCLGCSSSSKLTTTGEISAERTDQFLSKFALGDLSLDSSDSCERLNVRLRKQALHKLKSYWQDYNGCEAVFTTSTEQDGISSISSDSTSSESSNETSAVNFTKQNSQVDGVLEPHDVFATESVILALNVDEINIYKALPADSINRLYRIDDLVEGKFYNFSKMIVSGDTLYVFGSTSDDGISYAGMIVFDISDPTSPVATKETLISDSSWSNGRLKGSQLVNVFLSSVGISIDYKPDSTGVDRCEDEAMTEEYKSLVLDHIEEEEARYSTWSVESEMPTIITRDLQSDSEESETIACAEIFENAFIDGAYLTIMMNDNVETSSRQVNTMLSRTSNIYMNEDVLILQSELDGIMYKIMDDDSVEISASALHLFDLENLETNGLAYQGAGPVPGSVPDSWAINEDNGVITVASEISKDSNETPDDIVVTVLTNQETSLEVIGFLKDLVSNEEIFAARYVDDNLYLVTYEVVRNRDPLFVIDLSDNTNPTLLGSLEMPGFSSYLQLIDEGLLLGIGSSDSTCWFWGECLSDEYKISLYDVSDASLPTGVAQETIEVQWTESNYDHLDVHFDSELNRLFMPYTNQESETKVSVFDVIDASFSTASELSVSETYVGSLKQSLQYEDEEGLFLYVVGDDGIQVFNTETWEMVSSAYSNVSGSTVDTCDEFLDEATSYGLDISDYPCIPDICYEEMDASEHEFGHCRDSV